MEMILLIVFVICVFVGVYANSRGRNGFGWFLLAVVTSPLIAWLILIALPRKNRVVFVNSNDGTMVLSDGKVMTMTRQGSALLNPPRDNRVRNIVLTVLLITAALIAIYGPTYY